jgi:hypothetical protein
MGHSLFHLENDKANHVERKANTMACWLYVLHGSILLG